MPSPPTLIRTLAYIGNQSFLELGAGGGLTGIVTAQNGARKVISYGYGRYVQDALILVTLQVVLTDYPDADLLEIEPAA